MHTETKDSVDTKVGGGDALWQSYEKLSPNSSIRRKNDIRLPEKHQQCSVSQISLNKGVINIDKGASVVRMTIVEVKSKRICPANTLII